MHPCFFFSLSFFERIHIHSLGRSCKSAGLHFAAVNQKTPHLFSDSNHQHARGGAVGFLLCPSPFLPHSGAVAGRPYHSMS